MWKWQNTIATEYKKDEMQKDDMQMLQNPKRQNSPKEKLLLL